MATVAMNVVLESGKLVPLRQPRLVTGAANYMENGLSDVADAQSMHIWRRNGGGFDFLLFPGVTWAVPGNIASDDLTRIVVSGETGQDASGKEPVIYARAANGVKVVKPLAKKSLSAPIVSRASETPPLDDNRRYTRFFVAWVDDFGFESPASAPSGNLTVMRETDGWSIADSPDHASWIFSKSGEANIQLAKDAVVVTYSGDPQTFTAEYGTDGDLEYMDGDSVNVVIPGEIPADAVKVRVYKVIAGSEEGRSQFVYERDASARFTVPGIKDEDAGEVMPEIENPPDGLQDILDVPGAFYVGFAPSAPKTVCFSDVDLLYSWPTAYRYDISDNIVALAVTSNSVFALTDGWPYVLSGTAPESMTVAKLASPAACVSVRGVTVLKNTVFYASNAGLMAISNSANEGTVVQNATEQIFTKDQWQALNPKSCLLGHHKGRLFLYFTAPGGGVYGDTVSFLDPDGLLGLAAGRHVGLTVNLSDGLSVAVTAHDEAAKCLCVDNAEDKMYFVREGV
jgi:hypothetical protein